MKNQRLFFSNGTWVTSKDLLDTLKAVGAQNCNILYMHTGLTFGVPNPELSRSELLRAMYETVLELGVTTLCVPTFTFSFCNGKDYSVSASKSYMGALNEYIRRQPESIRSVDPLMSVALVGKDRDLVENLGHESTGENSTFDKLSRKKGVKFLFLGVGLGDCFTYMHYLEWMAKVPYRYDREFSGKITNEEKSWKDTYTLFVRYNNVFPNDASYTYGQLLEDEGSLKSARYGDSLIGCVNEADARALYLDLIANDPNYFIKEPFTKASTDTTFIARNMVAL